MTTTTTTKTNELTTGTEVYYTGDAANAEDYGRIIEIREPNSYRNGGYVVKLDDGRTFTVQALDFTAGPGRRFWVRSEWEADRAKRMTEMMARMQQRKAGV